MGKKLKQFWYKMRIENLEMTKQIIFVKNELNNKPLFFIWDLRLLHL